MSRLEHKRVDISDKPLCPYTIEMCARALEDEAARSWSSALKISQKAQQAMENGDHKTAEMYDVMSITLQEINHHHYRAAEVVRSLVVPDEDS